MMKKTTYLLIIILGVFLVVAFLSPVLFFKERDYMAEYKESQVEMTAAGSPQHLALESFTTISEVTVDGDAPFILDYYFPMGLKVIESDTLSTPVVDIDSVWSGNVEVFVVNDSLRFNVTMKALIPTARDYTPTVLPNEESPDLAVVRVPRGMLRQIDTSNASLSLIGFKDASLEIFSSSSQLDIDSCSFSSLTLRKH